MRLTCFLVVLFFTLQSTTCSVPLDCRLQVSNQSNDSITFIVAKDSVIDCNNLKNTVIMNDTVYINSLSEPLRFFNYYIAPHSKDNMCIKIGKNAWVDYAKFKNKRIYVFFIEADKMIKTDEGILLPCELSFKRQSYTLDELKRNNWVITYPE